MARLQPRLGNEPATSENKPGKLEDDTAASRSRPKFSGVNPNLIHEANAAHRQAMAVSDLDRHIQMSMDGLRSDVGTAATKAARRR
jgi:hypothetical protein